MNDFWKQPIPGEPEPFDPWANPGESTFHEDVAERVCAYWESEFSLRDGRFAGKPFKLEDWQRQFIGHLFGWKRPDGTRRFRTAFLYVPKKNGKTQIGAGLALLLLHADGENGAKVFSCAADTTQAALCFDAGKLMVHENNNPRLASKLRVYTGYKSIEYEATASTWKVLSSLVDTKHGPNVHGLLVDELHTQKTDDLIETLEAGTIARTQPLVVKMTTAGHTGDTPCNRELDYATGVIKGEIEDPSYLPMVFNGTPAYQKDSECWKDPVFWERMNPNFGVTVQAEFFKKEVAKCQTKPTHAEVVKRLHLNIQTDTAAAWLDYGAWEACAGGVERHGPAFYGLDLAKRTDLAAIAIYWPDTKSFDGRLYLPETTAESRAEYKIWAKSGHLIVTPGETIDYRYIRDDLNQLRDEYGCAGIAYDDWNATHLAKELGDDDGFEMIAFNQDYKSYNSPCQDFEKDLIGRLLHHPNHPVINWMIRNVSVREDNKQRIMPVKEKRNSTKKIDWVTAAVMAYAIAGTHEPAEEPETDTVIVIT